MATQTSSTMNYNMGTAANWQALWGGVVDAFLQANGWTYVSQTGDGDPNTATPGSSGSYACFRVYSTSVGSETWYMRIDFGYDGNGPACKIQFGTGANGSGTLTGQTNSQKICTMGNSITGTGKFYAISSATGRFSMQISDTATTSGGASMFWSFHGGVNGSGTLTSGWDYVFKLSNVWTVGNIPISGTVPTSTAALPMIHSAEASNVIGSHTMTFHLNTWNESGGNNPSPALMAVGVTDAPTSGVGVTGSLYASTRTWFSTAQTHPDTTNLRTCFLYE